MACCAGDSVRGAIPGFKFGKPLKENFHDKKVHPYIDTVMKYTITKKERIRHPSGVKSKDLDKLRKMMQKASDGLELKKEGITGAQGMAIIKEILVKLPTPLLGKNQACVNAWLKASKKVNTQPSSTSWSTQDLNDVNKMFKDAYDLLEFSNQLMFRHLIAFIRILSQHPDTHVVRPKQAQAMVKYYTPALVDPKTSSSDLAIFAKGVYFLVDTPEELFGPNLEEAVFPLKGFMPSRGSGLEEDEAEMDSKKEGQRGAMGGEGEAGNGQQQQQPQQPQAQQQQGALDNALHLKDYTLLMGEAPSPDPLSASTGSLSGKTDTSYGLDDDTEFKSKLDGLDLDDPNYMGLDIWRLLVENVEQQAQELKNTMRSGSSTTTAATTNV